MKFVCDNCSTQYLISDDKVGTKGVKVRCKRCGDVILVRPPNTEDQRATDPAGRADALAGDADPFASREEIDRDDVGMAFDQLLRGGLGSDGDDDGSSSEELATEIFRMDDIKRPRADEDSSDRDKIDQAFARVESTQLRPKAAGGERSRSDWYVAIGDEQVGPMGQVELEKRWALGEIDASTLCWFPSMADWTPIGHVEQLDYLLRSQVASLRDNTEVDAPGADQAQPSAAPAGSTGNGDWAPYKGSELASLVEEEMAIVSQPPPEDEPASEDAGPSEFLPPEDGEVPPWEQDEPASGEIAKPAESFFDSTLDKADGKDEQYFDGAYSRSGRVLAGPAYLGGASKKNAKTKWIVIAVLGGVLLVGVTVAAFAFFGQKPPPVERIEPLEPPTPPVTNPAGVEGPKQPNNAAGASNPDGKDPGPKPDAADQPKPPTPADGAGEDGKKPTGGGEVVVAKPAGVAPSDRTDSSAPKPGRGGDHVRKKRRTQVAEVHKVEKPAAGTHSQPKPAAGDQENLPQKVSKSQISETMKKYIGAMKSCVEQQRQRDPSVTGTMQVSFTIEPSGKVTTVQVKTAEHKGTYVAGCISFIIKSMTFPKAREPFTVPVLPLRLGG